MIDPGRAFGQGTGVRPTAHGLDLDPQTRCAHWHGPLDVIALKMRCCGAYYACRECHDALAGHPARVWPKAEWDQPAVLCGACGTELSIRAYLACASQCPVCGAGFNPGCYMHRHLYFATGEANSGEPDHP
jgi:uncharacterized CHY-type Zn-finger protein